MRATSGRAVSATILQRLQHALAQGRPLTYLELAQQAGCTVRSVRNYLQHAEQLLGFDVEKKRDRERVLVRAVLSSPSSLPPSSCFRSDASPLDSALSDRLFPPSTVNPLSCVQIAFPNLPHYAEHHARVCQAWIRHAQSRTHALRFLIPTVTSTAPLWPLGIVVNHHMGIVLIGFPCHETDPKNRWTLELIRLPNESTLWEPIEREAPDWVKALSVRDLFDSPFCFLSDQEDKTIDVHVRFDASLTERLRHCVWHSSQSVVLRTDGMLDVRFGPVSLAWAASWVSSFGASVTVLGDKKLCKTVKKRSFSV